MARKKTTNNADEKKMEFLYGKENAKKSMYRTLYFTHTKIVRECEYCGRGMTASDCNDYGSLCESCYMKEYY